MPVKQISKPFTDIAITPEQLQASMERRRLRQEAKNELRRKFLQNRKDISAIKRLNDQTDLSFGDMSTIIRQSTPLMHDLNIVNKDKSVENKAFIPKCDDAPDNKPILDKSDSLGATSLINNMVRELVDQMEAPVNKYLGDTSQNNDEKLANENLSNAAPVKPIKPPKSPNRLLTNISDIKRRLRSRSKLRLPLRFRDPKFTK